MHMLAANWGLFLVAAFVFAVAGVLIQLSNVKAMMNGATTNNMIRRAAAFAVFTLSVGVSLLLAVIGVIANLMGK